MCLSDRHLMTFLKHALNVRSRISLMWLGWVFISSMQCGICILRLTRVVRLRHRQNRTVQYGIRILSVRTPKADDKVKEAVILSSTRSAKRHS